MGILSDFLGLWDGNLKSGTVGSRKSLRNRVCRIEEIEPREMLSASPYEPPELISVGVVFHEDYYIEQDAKGDSGGDTFIVSWHGGAADTKLTELVIDLNVYNVSEYLYFFADTSQPAGEYSKTPFGFTVTSDSGIGYSHILEKDSNGLYTKLTITFDTDELASSFTQDKQFVFKIDVNSYSNIPDKESGEKVTAVLQGKHFEDSTISATFESANYETLIVNDKFLDKYSDPSDFELNVPSDKYYPDNDPRDRQEKTAGAIKKADDPQSPKNGSISGYVYEDLNNDGVRDAAKENGIADVWLELFVKNETTGVFESTGLQQKTDANGHYIFDDIEGGKTYRVLEVTQPADYVDGKEQIGTIGGITIGEIELPDAITNIHIGANEQGENYNFGELKKGSIAGYVYKDKNNNGQKENGEDGIAGVELSLLIWNGAAYVSFATTQTDANGYYEFSGLAPFQKYKVVEDQPANYVDGKESIGHFGDGVPIGNADVNDEISEIDLPFAGEGVNYNFGELENGTLSGYVYKDKNNNGIKENGEDGIKDVTLSLWVWNGTQYVDTLRTAQTNDQGYYEFTGLEPLKKYKITESQPTDYFDGKESVGYFVGDTGVLVGDASENDVISEILLPSNGSGVNYNFGELEKGTISGNVYEDKDNDGTKDDDETGIGGITIYLCVLDENGQKINISQTVTDENGNYFFDNLEPNRVYCVTEEEPDGYCDGINSVGTIDGVERGDLTETADGNDQIQNIQINSGDNGINYNFAENRKGKLSGYVYDDKNKNGQKDNGEIGIKDVTLSLWVWNGTQYVNTSKTAKTDATGYYQFDNLCPFKTYQIIESQPENYIDGDESIGTINDIIVGISTENDKISEINLPPAGQGINYNFAEFQKNTDPDPEDPDPEDPDPEDPDPENPDPENPDPENPDPEDPDPNIPVVPTIPFVPPVSVPYVPSVGASGVGVAGVSPSWQQPVMNNGLQTGYGSSG
ncbi:MAG: hypothetical protein LBK06_00200, partial [Planctomycetaceae bacterium]|nr:hypothetical protein [Planctomycetaceae bacterium]